MFRLSLGFFVVALIAAIFGFAGVAIAAAGIAKILFFIFVILFLASLLASSLDAREFGSDLANKALNQEKETLQ